MRQYIAILRGINVGGKRKVLMKDLKALFVGLGFANVQTYIQSGNVVFESEVGQYSIIEGMIGDGIVHQYGFEVPVIVRTAHEWKQLVEDNPYKGEDINQLHVTFFKAMPSNKLLTELKAFVASPDEFTLLKQQVYIRCFGKYHETKLGNNIFEKKLKISCTTRNWKTILAILKLL